MKIKTTPDYGSTRTRKVFLWLPRKFFIREQRDNVTDYYGASETLWLETIEIDEEWCRVSREQYAYWQMKEYRRTK